MSRAPNHLKQERTTPGGFLWIGVLELYFFPNEQVRRECKGCHGSIERLAQNYRELLVRTHVTVTV